MRITKCESVAHDQNQSNLLSIGGSDVHVSHDTSISFFCVRVATRRYSKNCAGSRDVPPMLLVGAAAFLDVDNYTTDPEQEILADIEKHLPDKKKSPV